MILLFFSYFVFSYRKGKWCKVCVPWAMGVQFHDSLSDSMLGGYKSCTDLGKKIPSKRICLYFSSFSLPSKCAKPPPSLVKLFLVKCQNLTCLIFLLENKGSVCILLVFPLHQSYKALV